MSKKSAKTKEVKEPPTYEIRDIVLGKIRGYPPWPGMVVDPETVPPAVSADRPPSKKNPFYCVRFFPKGDYSWLPPKELTKLNRHEIENYGKEGNKKNGDLLKGYQIALDPREWEEEKRQEAERIAAQLAEQAETSEENDELVSESGASASSSKKRKRSADASKKASGGAKRTASKRGGGGGGRTKKSKATIESEDDGDGEGEDDDEEEKPATKKAKTNKGIAAGGGGGSKGGAKGGKKGQAAASSAGGAGAGAGAEAADEDTDPEATKVKEWRHKLQKAFLSNKEPDIKPEDMPTMDTLFTEIETYGSQMTISSLQASKIGKVMRHITGLKDDKIPIEFEERFRFRERAKGLIEGWQVVLNQANLTNSNGGGEGGDALGKELANAVNGSAVANANGAYEGDGDVSMMTALDVTMNGEAAL